MKFKRAAKKANEKKERLTDEKKEGLAEDEEGRGWTKQSKQPPPPRR